jgi:predicted dehydrogenase
MKILVIGAGMYVCGRGTDGYGTVLPALYQTQKDYHLIDHVSVCATSRKSLDGLLLKKNELDKKFDMDLSLDYWPREGKNSESYLEAISNLKDGYDCGIIVVPDHQHYEIAEAVLKAGIHLLIVKPFVTEVNHAIDLIELAEKNNLYGSVEFHKRYDYANIKLRDELRNDLIGDPLYFHVEYSQRKSIPEIYFSKWSEKTNVFQYLGVHYVDLIYFLTGALPTRVIAIGQKNWLIKNEIDTYDSMEVVIEWVLKENNFISTHLTNWIDPNTTSAMSDQKIKVVGTKGRIESDQKNRGIQIVTDQRGIEDFNPYFSQFYRADDGDHEVFKGYSYKGFSGFIRDVQSIINGDLKIKELDGFRPTIRSALVSTSVIEAVNKSLNSDNSWIEIDSFQLNKYLNNL